MKDVRGEGRKRIAQMGFRYLAGALACYWAGDEAETDRWLRRVDAVVEELRRLRERGAS